MNISKFALFRFLLLLSAVSIWALPDTNKPTQSQGERSFDEIVESMFRLTPTHINGEDKTIQTHKGALTQGWSQYLSSEFPNKNILIYHNQDSTFKGANAVHKTVELTSDNVSGNHTYEIQVFDSGTFVLAGESGYHNWAFYGNWSQSGRSVIFNPLTGSSRTHRLRHSPLKLGGGYISSYIKDVGSSQAKVKRRSFTDPTTDPQTGLTTSEYIASYDDPAYIADAASSISMDSMTWEFLTASTALGPEATAAVLILVAIVALGALFGEVISQFSKAHGKERAFTQSTAGQHASAVPDRNVIVFHNQDSQWNFIGWNHQHYELDLGSIIGTKGYEIYSFDYGNFTLAGDGGFENWAFNGNYEWTKGSSNVIFYPRTANCHAQLLRRTQADSEKQLRLRQLIPPEVPTRENPETTDGYYFVDCTKPDGASSLAIAYYKEMDADGGNRDQLPDDFVEVPCNHAGVKAWQGEGEAILAARGAPFHFNFMHQGWEDDLVTVGTAETSFEQFWIYKDTGQLLFNTTENWACKSLYYTF